MAGSSMTSENNTSQKRKSNQLSPPITETAKRYLWNPEFLLKSNPYFPLSNQQTEDSNEQQFQQSGYHVVGERTEVVTFNKNYLKRLDIRNVWYNRTTHALNVTVALKVGLSKDVLIVGQIYKFMSNEYRYFPIRLQIHLCDIFEKNVFGVAGFKKCGNFTQCPLEKDRIYHSCNWALDESKYPPLMPSGRYMGEFQGTYFGTELFVVNGYITINVPFLGK